MHILRTFITHLLVHIRQKKKIALEIAAKNCKCKRVFTKEALRCGLAGNAKLIIALIAFTHRYNTDLVTKFPKTLEVKYN
jgi:hypothetical protein